MQSVQRQFGKMMGHGGRDKSQVIALVKDYQDVDNAIGKIIADAQLLQQSWHDISVFQTAIARGYQDLYDPIVGTSEEDDRPMAETPPQILDRTSNLHNVYANLQDELADEIACIESQLLRPAIEAKQLIHGYKATIKKRENKRLDVERVQDKVFTLRRKMKRSTKEETQLVKSKAELEVLQQEFDMLDERLQETLAPLVRASFELLPPLLATHITIQNRLLGLTYTVLHGYCIDNGFPSPPPDMDVVTADWNAAFQPTVRIVETFAIVRKHPVYQRPGTNRVPTSRQLAPPQSRTPSSASIPAKIPSPSPEPSEPTTPSPRPEARRKPSGVTVPTDFTTATIYNGHRTSSSTSLRSDYFAAAAAKKKPPPPPVPKLRKEDYVVAEYDFAGGVGDLSFSEGDMIKVISRTDTDQDWWQGELHNIRGAFPANYCKPVS